MSVFNFWRFGERPRRWLISPPAVISGRMRLLVAWTWKNVYNSFSHLTQERRLQHIQSCWWLFYRNFNLHFTQWSVIFTKPYIFKPKDCPVEGRNSRICHFWIRCGDVNINKTQCDNRDLRLKDSDFKIVWQRREGLIVEGKEKAIMDAAMVGL